MGCCIASPIGFTPAQVSGLEGAFASIPDCYYGTAVDHVFLVDQEDGVAHRFDADKYQRMGFATGEVQMPVGGHIPGVLQQLAQTLGLESSLTASAMHIKVDCRILALFLLSRSKFLMAVSLSGKEPHNIAGLDTSELQLRMAEVLQQVDNFVMESKVQR
mmetsp:Transcript_137656/g.239333  ORF Transcript_137656/g.239333 Transcript_137656/m.239333 type:complete len:160 (-) Transcript_137656:329-808(-)